MCGLNATQNNCDDEIAVLYQTLTDIENDTCGLVGVCRTFRLNVFVEVSNIVPFH